MSDKKLNFNADNFLLLINAYFQVFIFYGILMIMFVFSLLVLIEAWYLSSIDDASHMARIGTVIQAAAIIYIYLTEFVLPTPAEVASEIESDPNVIAISKKKGSKQAYEKLLKLTTFSRKVSRKFLRSTEVLWLVFGTLLSGYGDIIYITLNS